MIIAIVVIAIIGIGGYYYKTYGSSAVAPSTSPGTTATSSESTGGANAKINIDAVCQGALSYMTFANGAAADAFVADCKAGKHPEVIQHYKEQMGISNDAAI